MIKTGLALMLLALSGSRPNPPIDDLPPMTNTVRASWYDYTLWGKYEHYGARVSTCAFHHQYKDYKYYKITNIANGKSVVCFNNDWMRSDDKYVDLSKYAFSKIGNLDRGVLQVTVEKIGN